MWWPLRRRVASIPGAASIAESSQGSLDMDASDATSWVSLSASVCGAGHLREAAPNQDAIAVEHAVDEGFVVVAVADGHGDIYHLRSAEGAGFAVRALVDQVVADRCRLVNAEPARRLSVIREIFADVLKIWRQRVVDHHREQPVQPEEYMSRGLAPEPAAAAALDASTRGSLALYGSTLLAVAVWRSGGVAIRVGDGHVVVLGPLGDSPVRAVFTDDFGETTQSLCADDPCDVMECVSLDVETMVAITISTDGYSKSFRQFEDFLANMQWVVRQIDNQPEGTRQEWLEDWLKEVSRDGSEDDVSFGLLRRSPAVVPPAAESPASEQAPQ